MTRLGGHLVCSIGVLPSYRRTPRSSSASHSCDGPAWTLRSRTRKERPTTRRTAQRLVTGFRVTALQHGVPRVAQERCHLLPANLGGARRTSPCTSRKACPRPAGTPATSSGTPSRDFFSARRQMAKSRLTVSAADFSSMARTVTCPKVTVDRRHAPLGWQKPSSGPRGAPGRTRTCGQVLRRHLQDYGDKHAGGVEWGWSSLPPDARDYLLSRHPHSSHCTNSSTVVCPHPVLATVDWLGWRTSAACTLHGYAATRIRARAHEAHGTLEK